jgi:hypothetical protein
MEIRRLENGDWKNITLEIDHGKYMKGQSQEEEEEEEAEAEEEEEEAAEEEEEEEGLHDHHASAD